MILTSKQSKFVDEYLIDSNAKRAVIAAGYSGRNIIAEANRLLQKPHVAAEIERRRKLPSATGEEKPLKSFKTPLEYMLAVMRDERVEPARRDKMAAAAAPFCHARAGEKGGKKEGREKAAKKASTGRFAPAVAPNVYRIKKKDTG